MCGFVSRVAVFGGPRGLGAHRARLRIGMLDRPCRIGRSGIGADKREGDGRTPRAELRLREGWFRADRIPRPRAGLPLRPLRPEHGWCDDPAHRRYNRRIARPFAASHETLWRDDTLYDLVLAFDWNTGPIRPGKGSAIFLHLERPDRGPTAGCLALPLGELRQLLARCGSRTRFAFR